MKSTRHSTDLVIRGEVRTSPGLATRHSDGTVEGHVDIYLDSGSVHLAADSPEALRTIAGALHQAADRLEDKRVPRPEPVSNGRPVPVVGGMS